MIHEPITALLLSLAAAASIAHLVLCAYAIAFPSDVAQELVKTDRSFQGWLFLYALRIGRYDRESDLQPALDPTIVAGSCRRRATIGVVISLFTLTILALVFSGAIPLKSGRW